MNMPAQAFSMQTPQTLAFGSVFRLRESWAFLVNNQQGAGDPVPAYIMLEGERVGTLFKMTEGMPTCLGLMAPFEWFPGLLGEIGTSEASFETASLCLTDIGLVIVGGILDSWGDSDSFAFDMRGEFVGRAQSRSITRLGRWSAELSHPARPYLSLGRLFEVDRRRD